MENPAAHRSVPCLSALAAAVVCLGHPSMALANVLITPGLYEIRGNWDEVWYTLEDPDGPVYSGPHSSSGSFSETRTTAVPLEVELASEPFGFGRLRCSLDSLNLNLHTVHVAAWGAQYGDDFVNTGTQITLFAEGSTYLQSDHPQLEITLMGYAQYNYFSSEQSLTVTFSHRATGTVLHSWDVENE